METKTLKNPIGISRPARQECVRTKSYGTTKLNVQAFSGFPCTDKASIRLLCYLKIQDVSRHPDTVAAVKIHSYVTAYDIFQHRQYYAPEFSRLMLPPDYLSPNRIIAVILLTGQ